MTDTTVQAIISWLSWITEQESQQPIRPTLTYRPTQYMQHLQVTYEAHISRTDWSQEAMDVTSHQRRDQEAPLASSGEVTETGTDIQGEAWTDTEPPATAISNLTNSDRSAGQQDRRAEVTNGEADHFPQLQAASPIERPQVPRNQTKTNGPSECPHRRNSRRATTSRKRNYCEEEVSPPR